MLSNSLLAQNIRTSTVARTYMLTGSINNNKHITMLLTIDDENNASGGYYYHGESVRINVKGKATLNGAIVLHEITDHENKTEFIGTLDTNSITFSGNFTITNTEVEMPFSLSKSKASLVNYAETIGIYYYDTFKYKYEYIKLYSDSDIKGVEVFNRRHEYSAERNKIFVLSLIEENSRGHSKERSKYVYDTSSTFIYADENIVSIASKSYEYIGGDNSYGGLAYYIYDIKTGRLLSENLQSLITDKNNQRLIALLRQKLLENYSRSDFFSFEKIMLNNNFYIDEMGVHFAYNQSEIAHSSKGEIFVSFTFDELKPFVDNNAIFYYLFL